MYETELSSEDKKHLAFVLALAGSVEQMASKGGKAAVLKIAEKLVYQYLRGPALITIKQLFKRASITFTQWTLSPFLVAASSGLGEEALAGEASEAAAGDVDGCLVGGHAEEFVQLTGSELLVGVLVEGVHDGLVNGVRLGRIGVGLGSVRVRR